MLFNVPQYIDVEDKVAGPLTAKQLLWMIGMGAALMFLWSMLNTGAFFAAAIPVVCAFVALAFYRPYNQPLAMFIANALLFMIRPKIYVWERPTKRTPQRKEKNPVMGEIVVNKQVTVEEVNRLAKIVDSQRH